MKQLGFLLKQTHNISQVLLWLYVFVAQIPQEGPLMKLDSWKMNQYWDPTDNFKTCLIWGQSLQLFDVVFSILGLTRNSVPTVFVQILSRYFILYGIFPYVPEGHFAVFMACICWAWTEVIRFSFYALKEFDVRISIYTIPRMIGFFRYISFIVLYPLGVSGELISCYKAWQHFKTLPQNEKPFTYSMPNTLNIAFDFEFIIQVVIPLVYLAIFPQLYGHMIIQRSKYNKSIKDDLRSIRNDRAKAALKIDEKIREFTAIKGLTKLVGTEVQKDQTIERGQDEVLLIDFWATWCGPCQKPMQHNQDMAKKNFANKKWQGKARIIGISLDTVENVLRNEIINKNWDKVEHYQRIYDESIDRFDIQGIPCVLLVNKKGQVVFKGHPSLRKNLEQDINDLIAGKDLTL